jgi:hypothetical protein
VLEEREVRPVRNEAYVGIWRYKQKQWVKVPGTNTRRPRKRDVADVIVREYPERRIIPSEIWERHNHIALSAQLGDEARVHGRAMLAGGSCRGEGRNGSLVDDRSTSRISASNSLTIRMALTS